ncbi:hypothetical protein JCM8547_005755 [Rhodosporidiobolus lusitaniae]
MSYTFPPNFTILSLHKLRGSRLKKFLSSALNASYLFSLASLALSGSPNVPWTILVAIGSTLTNLSIQIDCCNLPPSSILPRHPFPALKVLPIELLGTTPSFTKDCHSLKEDHKLDIHLHCLMISTRPAGLGKPWRTSLTVVVLFFRRYPEWVKTTLWVAAAVSCSSMFLSSWSTQVWHLILSQGIVCVVECTRGLAFGIVLSGIGVGGFGFPFLIDTLLSVGGFPWLCRAWVLITGVVFSLSAWLGGISQDPIFLLTGFSSLLAGFSYLPVALYLPQYAASLISSTTQQNLVLAICNRSSATGSAGSGSLSDWSYPTIVMGCAAAGTVISLAAWGTADSLAKVFVFAVLFAGTGQMVSAWGHAAKEVSESNPNTTTLILCLFSVVLRYRFHCHAFLGVTAFFSRLGGIALQVVRRKRLENVQL